MWSLRTLVAAPNDWRSRLPDTYWDLLGLYQSVERALVASPSAELKQRAASLEMQLQQIEATASNGSHTGPEENQSALLHARKALDADSVLLSFHVSGSQSWLWAVDRQGVAVYPISQAETLKASIAEFVCAVKDGNSQRPRWPADVPAAYSEMSTRAISFISDGFSNSMGRFLILPFAALVPGYEGKDQKRKNEPIFLFERRELETIPGALMLEPRTPFGQWKLPRHRRSDL